VLKKVDMAALSPQAAVDFLLLAGQLKRRVRRGWVLSGVTGPESVADHSWRMAVLAQLAAAPPLDAQRCVRIALVHDLAEALVGDIAPADGVPKPVKARMELAAMETIRRSLRGHPAGDTVFDAFNEYEASESPESHLVHDLDRLEMVAQALQYEQEQPALDLSTFFDSTRGKWRTPLVRSWADEVEARRIQMRAERAAAVAATGQSAAPATLDGPQSRFIDFQRAPPLGCSPPISTLVPLSAAVGGGLLAAAAAFLAGVAWAWHWRPRRG